VFEILHRLWSTAAAGPRDTQIHQADNRRRPIQLFGDGTTRRDYTYIDDIIQGVCAAIEYEGSSHEVFNLGESETTELSRLIELIEASLGIKAMIDRQPMQPGDVPLTYADISKARRMLGMIRLRRSKTAFRSLSIGSGRRKKAPVFKRNARSEGAAAACT
jgi:UDP-glucuronate 4-epimerase